VDVLGHSLLTKYKLPLKYYKNKVFDYYPSKPFGNGRHDVYTSKIVTVAAQSNQNSEL